MSERPKDFYGQPVTLDAWYWAKNRAGQTVGVGTFAPRLGSKKLMFWINGTSYALDSFTAFVKASEPTFRVVERFERDHFDRPLCPGWGLTRRCGVPVHPGYTRCPKCDRVYTPAMLEAALAHPQNASFRGLHDKPAEPKP